MMDKVITYGGKTVDKSLCRRIGGAKNGHWFIIGDYKKKDSGECYLIHSKTANRKVAYRAHTDKITWDYYKQEYVIVDQNNLSKGVVGYKNGRLIKGYYTHTDDAVIIKTGSPYIDKYTNINSEYCPSKELAETFAHVSPYDTYWYPKHLVNNFKRSYVLSKNDLSMYRNFDSRTYSFDNQNKDYLEKNYISKYNKNEIESIFTIMEELFGKYTCGIEIETNSGRIPELPMVSHGFIPVKDGSINGVEYVSKIFKNQHDYKNLYEFTKLVNKHHTVNDSCSVHIHVGSILEKKSEKDRKLFIVAAYMLMCHLQNEVWEFLPKYKKDYSYLHKKRGKDHCQNLPSLGLFYNTIYKQSGVTNTKELNNCINTIFTFMNDGVNSSPRYNYKNRTHQKGQVEKWNYMSRYFNTNFFNMFFTKSNTIEFRHHSGTTNPYKILYWTIICLSIVKFIENNIERIISHKEKFNLTDIVEEISTNFGQADENISHYNDVAQALKTYIFDRKASFLQASFNYDIYNNEFAYDRSFEPTIKLF